MGKPAVFSRPAIQVTIATMGCAITKRASDCSLAARRLNSWVWLQSMVSQAHSVPRAFGLPAVCVQSCLAVHEYVSHRIGFGMHVCLYVYVRCCIQVARACP